jgi:hypothetical protein
LRDKPAAQAARLELWNPLPNYASRSLVGLHTFEGFPDFPLRDLEWLCRAYRILPSLVGQWPGLNNAAPSLQLQYRVFVITTGFSATALRFGALALAVAAACDLSVSMSTPRLACSPLGEHYHLGLDL